jgi:pyridoxamine 5'-phosphate oxidase
MSVAELRREYNLAGLRRKDLDPDPLVQFRRWFEQATGERPSGRLRMFLIKWYKMLFLIRRAEMSDLNAMTLSTADKEGRPSARVVLLKGLDERGFIFYTNYNSRKGRELAENPDTALTFYWPQLERQVCVAGTVSKVSPEESEDYFKSRPRGSRIAAWASDQSSVVQNRGELEEKWQRIEHQYQGKEVPRPEHWGGYVLSPSRIEFWQGRPNRLHDRFRYLRQPEGGWTLERLAP